MVEYTPQYFDSTDHFAYLSPHEPRRPHPISETGYRSDFVPAAKVAEAGGPEAFAALRAERPAAEQDAEMRKKKRAPRKRKEQARREQAEPEATETPADVPATAATVEDGCRTFNITVRGEAVIVEYTPIYYGRTSRFAFLSPHEPRRPHPLSETGHRTELVLASKVEKAGGPEAWTAHQAEVILADKEGRKRPRRKPVKKAEGEPPEPKAEETPGEEPTMTVVPTVEPK